MTQSSKLNELRKIFIDRESIANYIDNTHSICEVGVKNGEFFSQLVKNKPKVSVAVDLWDSYTTNNQNDLNYSLSEIQEFEKEFRKKFTNSKILKMTSTQAAAMFDNNIFDLVYIDADHTYESVKNDLNVWYPKVKSGGILSGHDYCEYYIEVSQTKFGVIKAVNEFLEENDLYNQFHVTKNGSPDDYWKSWIIFKP